MTHTDERGRARMVDVGDKPVSRRRARAEGRVRFGEEAFRLLRENRLQKGDALGVARLAGIQAAKRTADWIPLCHVVPLDRVAVEFEWLDATREIRIEACAEATARTGVEMESLVAVTAAGLALYDMVKAVDRATRLHAVRLLEKSGGVRGDWVASPGDPGGSAAGRSTAPEE